MRGGSVMSHSDEFVDGVFSLFQVIFDTEGYMGEKTRHDEEIVARSASAVLGNLRERFENRFEIMSLNTLRYKNLRVVKYGSDK